MDYSETSGSLWKLASEVSGRFPNFSINKKWIEKKITLIKNSETCRKPPQQVSGGFQRFSDNPSLTDLTVGIIITVQHKMEEACV